MSAKPIKKKVQSKTQFSKVSIPQENAILSDKVISLRNSERALMEHSNLKELAFIIQQSANDAASHAADALASVSMAVINAWTCGSALNMAKLQLEHGEFTKWVEDKFSRIPLSLRTAQRYMQLAKRYASVEKLIASNPTLRQAYFACGILSEPPEADKNTKKDDVVSARVVLLKSVTSIQNNLRRFSSKKLKLDKVTRNELVAAKTEIDRLFKSLIG